MLGNTDVNDAFCCIALAENRFSEAGYKESYDKGRQIGWLDGFDLGIQKGSQIGSEVWFYKGFVQTAKNTILLSGATDSSKEKFLKSLTAMESLLSSFPESNSLEDDNAAKLLNKLRGKFKQICSLLNVTNSLMNVGVDRTF